MLWGAQAFSLFGRWVHGFALSWHVYQTTQSAFWLGLVAALSSLPVLALSPLAGALVDRLSLRQMLLVTQGSLALLAGITAVLAMDAGLQGAALLGLSLAFGIVTAFDAPTFQAWLVEETRAGGLDRTIAWQSFAFNATKLVAPFIAGELVLGLGTSSCFLLNALSYLPLVLVILVSGRRHRWAPPATQASDGAESGPAAAPVETRSPLAMVAAFAFLGLPCISLMPSINGEVLDGGLRSFSIIMASVAAGAFLASAMFWLDCSWTRRHLLIPWSALVFAAGIFALFAPVGQGGRCVFAAVAGAAVCVFLTLCNHSVQAGVSGAARGRATSLYAGAVLGLPPLGAMALGGLGDAFGIGSALVIDCALLAALALGSIAAAQTRIAHKAKSTRCR